MLIRDVVLNDRERLSKMVSDFHNKTDASLHEIPLENYELTIDECLRSKEFARLLIMEAENEIIGFAVLSFAWSNEAGGKVVWIEELYFDELVRGRGCGKQFFEWLEEEYKDSLRFRLEVTYKNKGAISLYQRLGYEVLEYYQMIKDK